MTAHRAKVLRRDARWLGAVLLFLSWMTLSAATLGAAIEVEGWMLTVATIAGGGLIIWGSFKTRVEKLEEAQKADRVHQDREVEKRLSTAVFTQFQGDLTDRLERIERKLDGRSP